jgi:hypothetical protein
MQLSRCLPTACTLTTISFAKGADAFYRAEEFGLLEDFIFRSLALRNSTASAHFEEQLGSLVQLFLPH